MNVAELQAKIGTTPDGAWGPLSRAALLATFTNKQANGVTPAEMRQFAERLGCSLNQLHAVAEVESSGGGFERTGRPKILYERHYFDRLTKGRWSPSSFSNPQPGGYSISSWDKLSDACGHDPDAAFASCSWGRFQVMGAHWQALGYVSPYALAWTTAQSEGDHFELLARFIEANRLQDEMRAISTNPDDCRAFASAYNGRGYARLGYHKKLAREMA